MNVLVTNTRHAQVLPIIRSLRPYAQKIVATMYGKNRLAARLSHAANSRLVDERYYVSSPVEDWRAGRISADNTEREETYIREIIRICEIERIDTVYPSWDPHVYVFSKNKKRLKKIGILVPVPDYESVLVALDKYRTFQAAQAVGFPCPRTHIPEDHTDLKNIAEELHFPIVIRPRFTSGGRGMEIVRDFQELREKERLVKEGRGTIMVQEYIPGRRAQSQSSFRVVIDRNGELRVCFCTKRLRTLLRVSSSFSMAHELTLPVGDLNLVARLLQSFGWWGGADVGTKLDPRDGVTKLMEINPRFGARLWQMTELGINAPLMQLLMARGEEVKTVPDYPVGTLLIEPVEDLMGLSFWLLDSLFYKVRGRFLDRPEIVSLTPPMAFKDVAQSYHQTYCSGKKKVFNPYFRYFFQDPMVSILWWGEVFKRLLGLAHHLGR